MTTQPLLPRLLPALFRKHTGKQLQAAQPHILLVYYSEPGSRPADKAACAPAVGRLAHLTYHAVPSLGAARGLMLAAVVCTWLGLTPLELKLRCIVVASIYSLIEFSFTHLERGRAYTSVAQFVANVLYAPLLLDGYAALLMWATPAALRQLGGAVAYVLAFPLNVWLLEVVQGHAIVAVYGRNVAWCYSDYADARCNGCIRLGHGPFWVGLGAACWLFYPALIQGSRAAVRWFSGG